MQKSEMEEASYSCFQVIYIFQLNYLSGVDSYKQQQEEKATE